MAIMTNLNLYQTLPRSAMEPYRSRSIWRRTESNLESNFSGYDMFDMAPNRRLRLTASTLDLFSPDIRNTGSSTMLQSATEDNSINDSYVSNIYTNDNSATFPYYATTSSHVSSMNGMNGMGYSYGVSSKRVPFPAHRAFFGVPQQHEESYMTRYSSKQQPISRPVPKLNISNSDPTATTSALNDVKFPATANITDNLWSLYEEELKKQTPKLRKEHTEPLPKLTTQAEWSSPRRSYGLTREDRGRIWNTREELDAYTRKSFEDSLFPGGLEAFMDLNLEKQTQCDAINANANANANANGVQLRLASPTLAMRPISGPQIPPMSGKQLIEDLQEYEHITAYMDRPRNFSHSSSSHSLQSCHDQGGLQQDLVVSSNLTDTHDKDGRKRKGFKRGDGALQLALSEEWAVMGHALDAPIEIVPKFARYFVIKSNCELDVFASLKHGIWTSTDLGNQRLDKAFRDPHRKGPIYLFFSVSGSGKFCGVAEMVGPVDLTAHAGCWSDKRWRGRFTVQWKIVKDVLNSDLRHFRIVNNDNKPFTNCRDTQEIYSNVGDPILRMFINYVSNASLLQSPHPAPKYAVFEEHFLN